MKVHTLLLLGATRYAVGIFKTKAEVKTEKLFSIVFLSNFQKHIF